MWPISSTWLVALFALGLTACASVPPAPVTELKSLAGRWEGTGGFSGGRGAASGPVQLTLQQDGSGAFFLPQSNITAPVSFRLAEGGSVRYESTTSTGTAKLREAGNGKRVLLGEGVRKDGTGTSWFELEFKP